MPPKPPRINGSSVTIAALTFEIDPAWKSEPPASSMRAAQFRLPPAAEDQEAAQLVLFQGIGGTAQMNIDRWIGQFTQPDGSPVSAKATIERKQVSGLEVHLLDISGTFKTSMGPMMGGGAEKPGQRMLAAVVEGTGGPWHFKLTGPEKTVANWKPAFSTLIDSLQPAR